MTEKRKQVKWTPTMDAQVLKMLKDKCTASQIGTALGVTRNAVIGRVNRAKKLKKVGFFRASGNDRAKTVKAETIKPKPRIVVRVSPAIFNEPVAPKPLPVVTAGNPATVGRPIYLLGGCQCRWPVNEAARGEMHLFCASPADGPYCKRHARRSIGRGTESERNADRVLAKALA